MTLEGHKIEKSSAGTLTKVQDTAGKLLKISDVMQNDSKRAVNTATQMASDVMNYDLKTIAEDASSLASIIRGSKYFN